jgi:hypothetical protein
MAAGSVMAALVVGLTAVPALAMNWTVQPGGNFTGKSLGSTVITDTGTSAAVTCQHSKITGHLPTGTVTSGSPLGTIMGATFTGCTGGATLTAGASSFPWSVNAVGFANPITSGNITGIHLNLTVAGCTAKVDGTTTATADNGETNFRFSNADSYMKFIAPTTISLRIYVISGCTSAPFNFTNHDTATYIAAYAITPSQVIKSP